MTRDLEAYGARIGDAGADATEPGTGWPGAVSSWEGRQPGCRTRPPAQDTGAAHREGNTMDDRQPGPQTRGVTVMPLTTMDLGPEIAGMDGRQLRMRMVTIEPGGVYGPVHDHVDRPGTVYVLQGTITDHRDGVATDYGPGVGWPEDRNTVHWLENRGTVPAIEISVDIVRTSG